MVKKLSISVLLFLILCLASFARLPQSVYAAEEFAVDATVTYKVEDSGDTLVTHNVTLENLFSTVYATTYSLYLDNISAQNIEAREDSGRIIPLETKEENQKLSVKLIFPEPVVGAGEKRNFRITYKNSNFAVKTGEVWEISIPRLGDHDSFRNYTINLEVPDVFGNEAYVSPQPKNQRDEGGIQYFSFSKETIRDTGVVAGFGQFQVFTFNLSYHLENPLAVTSQTEIALPPDTAFQKVYFSKIEPKPVKVDVDSDGNYIATYKLFARQRLDITVEGNVQIFAGYRPFPKPSDVSLQENLLASNYWQVNDENIKMLARELKTPDKIYEYVSQKLKYAYERVQPNAVRMGAIGALQSPNQAICMEFTDLFVAISRAAGIPAREVNGYAYTENRELQPISLVADVLHAWPEYYDSKNGVWIPVDPTWGSTSGIDFFSKLDLRHFTFVIHGKNDKEPYPPGSYKLGPNPQKDVFVSFGKMTHADTSIPQAKVNLVRNIPFLDKIYKYTITNPGPSTLYSFYPTVYFDDKLHSRVFVQMLPPYGVINNEIRVPYSLLGKDTPDLIKVTANETEVLQSTNKSQVVVNTLVVLLAVFILVLLLILVKLKKINMDKITAKMTAIYAKITGKTRQGGNLG